MKVTITFTVYCKNVNKLRGYHPPKGSEDDPSPTWGSNFIGVISTPAIPRVGETIHITSNVVYWDGEVVVENVLYWLKDGVLKPDVDCKISQSRPFISDKGTLDASMNPNWKSIEDLERWFDKVEKELARCGFRITE